MVRGPNRAFARVVQLHVCSVQAFACSNVVPCPDVAPAYNWLRHSPHSAGWHLGEGVGTASVMGPSAVLSSHRADRAGGVPPPSRRSRKRQSRAAESVGNCRTDNPARALCRRDGFGVRAATGSTRSPDSLLSGPLLF
ncbi:hypothetical protein MRX96_036766 [Rhipicephalus microplus]